MARMKRRTKRPKAVHQLTAAQFDALFQTEDDCIRYLVVRRWPEGVRCPRCKNAAVYTLGFQKWHWQCTQCAPGGNTGYRFSHLTGTIFENTNKPLRDWYKVVHLMLVSKKGMSALQICRYMGFGSYKTAWLMCHKVRVALIEDIEKLGGIVEVDETYVGGSDKTAIGIRKAGKLAVRATRSKLPRSALCGARATSSPASSQTLTARHWRLRPRNRLDQSQSALHRHLSRI
jgi:transposase-like protein